MQDSVRSLIYSPFNNCKLPPMNVFVCDGTSCAVNQKANDYIRDNLIKAPKDMTYITNNLIGIVTDHISPSAMGFPGNPQTHKTETSVNKMDMTAYYLDAHHPNHYKLFNLAEETYDTLIFHGMVFLFSRYHAGGELQFPRLPCADPRSPYPHLHVDRIVAV